MENKRKFYGLYERWDNGELHLLSLTSVHTAGEAFTAFAQQYQWNTRDVGLYWIWPNEVCMLAFTGGVTPGFSGRMPALSIRAFGSRH